MSWLICVSILSKDYGFVSIASSSREEVTVAVQKRTENQKIGVSVGVRDGILVVREISPAGLFANTRLEVDDLVSSINGVDFQTDPDVSEAIRAVQSSKSTVTFVVRKKSGIQL